MQTSGTGRLWMVTLLAGLVLGAGIAVIVVLRLTTSSGEPAPADATVIVVGPQPRDAAPSDLDAAVVITRAPADAPSPPDAAIDVAAAQLEGEWDGLEFDKGRTTNFKLTLKSAGRAVFFEEVEPAPFRGTWKLEHGKLTISVSQRGLMPSDATTRFFDKWVLTVAVHSVDELYGSMLNFWDDAKVTERIPGDDLTLITTSPCKLKRVP